MPALLLTSVQPSSAPALVVDPVDYLLVDIATGRHLPGDALHAEQLAEEHGLTFGEAREAIDDAWQLGLALRGAGAGNGLVIWTPEVSQRQLHRLARTMVAAVSSHCVDGLRPGDVIDGEQARMGVVELFGLTTPCDVEVFLELGRALLGRYAPAVIDELAVPLAVMFSEAAQVVHGLEFAANDGVRCEIVSAMVRSLIDGEVAVFADLVADYVVALGID